MKRTGRGWLDKNLKKLTTVFKAILVKILHSDVDIGIFIMERGLDKEYPESFSKLRS